MNAGSEAECAMSVEIANIDVSRVVTLVGTSIAIFTFLLFFLYPRYSTGEVDAILFQFTLTVLGVAIFSLVFAGLFFYMVTLPMPLSEAKRGALLGRGDWFWLLGYSLFLLEPSLILFTVRLYFVGLIWLVLWLSYLGLTLYEYRKTRPPRLGRAGKQTN